ncbi:hypothetical protein EZV62_007999 [Acer yangbiense]|uniref:Uncharacterized protein n=1 Tax=Acer yangbiense TaxID=1000413 RepID=A0A5C7IC29_9ROSI|nr:hypothetical protein EZV62_007999 [Acer yangbiense]
MGGSQYLLIRSERRNGEGPDQLAVFPIHAMENSSQPDLDNPFSDDQIILHTLLSYIISMSMVGARGLPFWRTDGVFCWTAVIHPFAEMVVYFVLFGIPLITTLVTGTASMAVVFGYLTYIDFMNNMGHCNFELIPNCLFSIFPPLKYLMYTPS